jgi:hypothetical protein
MENMTNKLDLLQKQLHDLKKNAKYIKKGERDKVKLLPVQKEGAEPLTSEERAKISHLTKQIPGDDAARNRVAMWEEKIRKHEFTMKDKSDNKEVRAESYFTFSRCDLDTHTQRFGGVVVLLFAFWAGVTGHVEDQLHGSPHFRCVV